jgi:transcription elongation factor GreA
MSAEGAVTLGQALTEYLHTLKPDQRREASPYIRKYVDYAGDQLGFDALSASRVESFAQAQIRASDPSAEQRARALKAFFAYLKKKGYTSENYGVHIRVPRTPGRAPSSGTSATTLEAPQIEMTATGMEEARRRLDEMEAKRADLVNQIAVARADGDLRENAAYHAAREELGMTEGPYQQLLQTLKHAVVADQAADDRSSVGSSVMVTNLEDERQQTFTLVSPREANAAERKISVESPVGRELLGRRPGEEVLVATPRGEVRFRVDSVRHG